MIEGYKLVTVRKDGSYGPLFINKSQRLPVGEWLPAESHPTSGFKVRPYWHATSEPVAPHLSERGRAWVRVELDGVQEYARPESQGGVWYLADRMRIVGPVTPACSPSQGA